LDFTSYKLLPVKLVLYDLFIFLYQTGARLLTPFNSKARLWLLGRKRWASRLRQQVAQLDAGQSSTVVWMHASSLGEFEQGRPLLEKIRSQMPAAKIVVSFFSPSGYEAMKDYAGADIVCYMPSDTPANAQKFIGIVKPSLVLWVKYEYWYHHLNAIQKSNIPLLLVSGIFREQQPFFRWYGGLHRKMLCFFTHFFVQNEASATLLLPLVKPGTITVSGDTRFDRVIEIADKWTAIEPVEKWLDGAEKVIVAGSTWSQDEEELTHYIKANPDVKLIIAPHQVEPDILDDTLELFSGALLFSDLLQENIPETKSNVLIINNIGMLSRLYEYGNICYVGGGFTGDGVHNLPEAAVYGRPLVHGPEYEKYTEAIGLEDAGASFPIENALELEKVLNGLFTDHAAYNAAASAAKNYVYNHAGSTGEIIRYIYEKRLLTKR
jgi:3-deoxy-D-manno-octulosonic-acid transferase